MRHLRSSRVLLIFLAAWIVAGGANGQTNQISQFGKYQGEPAPALPEDGEGRRGSLLSSLAVEQAEDGRYRIGAVRVDPHTRTLHIPARVNMRRHVVEYALVTSHGKRHEALLVTDVRPIQVQLAAMLLGGKTDPSAAPSDHKLSGPAIQIEVTWDRNGPPAHHSLNQLIGLQESGESTNPESMRPFPDRPWVYTGSHTRPGGFAAETEGSLVALIGDRAALINQTGPSRQQDDVHHPRTDLLPRENFPVTVVLRFPPLP